MTHQVLVWELEERDPSLHFLIHDNDVKFTTAVDAVFQSEQIKVIHTPVQAPNAKTFIELWVRTVCEERLDKMLIINQVHLRRVLSD